MTAFSKDIFISYADEDEAAAIELNHTLSDWFGENIWMRYFNLNGGDLISNVIDEAMTEAKWLIVLMSKSAIRSEWIKQELNAGTIRSLQSDDFKIAIINLEEIKYPSHIAVAFQSLFSIDAYKTNREDGFMKLADHISQFGITHSHQTVYEGRGSDTDQLSLIAKRNKVIFIVGWRGIGKTTFIKESIGYLLRKKPITISLTHGHSIDLLSRQIIHESRFQQPISESEISNDILTQRAISALKQRENHYFLFIDEVEMGLDGSNRILPYLYNFINIFINSKTNTHIVLSTTRNPDFSEDITGASDIYRLGVIDDQYVKAIIYQWLQGVSDVDSIFQHSELDQLINIVGGHPLAAKRMASFLKVKTLDQLLDASRRERFQLGFADYILRATQDILSELHKLILYILATVREPMSQADMLSIRRLSNNHSIEDIHKARWELTDWFLIEQRGELMFLHGFLITHYSMKLKNQNKIRNGIVSDYGYYARQKAIDMDKQLNSIKKDKSNNHTIINISNEIFRYAIPADRLLRSIGKDSLADDLPIRVDGTLRGMVYYFYQEVEDHNKALEYAEKWIKLNPDDSDILLYRIRCYRKRGGKEDLSIASRLIAEMESGNHRNHFKIRILREKALIAQNQGDLEIAKSLFRAAIDMDRYNQPYSEIYTGLARIIIKEAENIPEWEDNHYILASEALDLLNIAKKEPDNFYRFHIDTYVEALLQNGQGDMALPLLEDALSHRPDDGKLNFRMSEIRRRDAEVSRKSGDHEKAETHSLEAEKYAMRAQENGYVPSILTHANILYDRAISQIYRGDHMRKHSTSNLDKALGKVKEYKVVHGSTRSAQEIEVADTIESKIYRTQNRLNEALNIMGKYRKSNNPFTVYEHSYLYYMRAESELSQGNYSNSLSDIREAISLINSYQNTSIQQINNLLNMCYEKERTIKTALNI